MLRAALFSCLAATTIDAGSDDRLLRIDETAYDVSAATGGDFYFWAPGEFATAGLRIPLPGEPVLLAYGTLGPETRRWSFPVDGTTGACEVFVGAQRLDDCRLRVPGGRVVGVGSIGASVQTYRHMRIFTLTEPTPGPWSIEVEGAGRTCVTVRARARAVKGGAAPGRATSPLLLSARFVERRGRPGHEGLFPIAGEVHAGEARRLLVRIDDVPEGTGFECVGEDGVRFQELDLNRGFHDAASDEWVGALVVPDRPFRVAAFGTDALGRPFRRVHAPIFSPKP